MYSVVVNLRSPKDWRLKVQEFVARLEDRFNGRLLLLVALPSPSDLLYDSNVLVVLDDIRPGDLEAVVSLAPEDVNPLVVPSGDRDAIDAFLNYEKDDIDKDEWLSRVGQFARSLKGKLGDRFLLLMALPSKFISSSSLFVKR